MTPDEAAMLTRHLAEPARFRVLRAMTDAMRRWEHARHDDGQTRLGAPQRAAAIFAAQEFALIVEGGLDILYDARKSLTVRRLRPEG